MSERADKLAAAAMALMAYEEAYAYERSLLDNVRVSAGVSVSWVWGASLPGYRSVQPEVKRLVDERFKEILRTAVLDLRDRANSLLLEAGCSIISLISPDDSEGA